MNNNENKGKNRGVYDIWRFPTYTKNNELWNHKNYIIYQ